MTIKRVLIAAALLASVSTSRAQAQTIDLWWDWAAPQALQGQVIETTAGHVIVVGDEARPTLALLDADRPRSHPRRG